MPRLLHGLLWLCLALSVPAQDDIPALTRQERLLLGLPDEDSASAPRALPVRIRVVGMGAQGEGFVRRLLPVHEGDTLETDDLQERLDAFNRRVAGRIDLFEHCVAMPLETDSVIDVLADCSPRPWNSWGGGNAWAMVGHPNWSGRGDRWGAWVGWNRLEALGETSPAPGLHVGGRGGVRTPLEDDAPDHGLVHLEAGVLLRQDLSTVASCGIEGGVWSVRADETRPDVRDPTILTLRPFLDFDETWARRALGIGAAARIEGILGHVPSSGSDFAELRSELLARSSRLGPASAVVLLQGGARWRPQAFQPSLPGGFHLREWQTEIGMIDRSASARLRTDLSLPPRPLAFTVLDLGCHVFVEAETARGTSVRAGTAEGVGIHAAFAPPVGVEFLLDAGWDAPRFLGLRFTTLRAF